MCVMVGIRGSSPSVGTRGLLLFVRCDTGGGRSLSVVVNGRRPHSLGSWHPGHHCLKVGLDVACPDRLLAYHISQLLVASLA